VALTLNAEHKVTLGMVAFLALWLTGLILPFVGWHMFGIGAASVIGLCVPLLWLMTMPCTCMDGGGLGGSLLAMVQVISGMIWAIVGIILLIGALF
jgi:hypothetical protein